MSVPGPALLLALGLPLLDLRAAGGARAGAGFSRFPETEGVQNEDALARGGLSGLLLHDSDSGTLGTLRFDASYDAPFGGDREITDGDYLFGLTYDLQHPFSDWVNFESSLIVGFGGRSRLTGDPTVAVGAVDADVLTTTLSTVLTYQTGDRWNINLVLEEASRIITSTDQPAEGTAEPDTHTALFALQFEHRFSDDLFAGGFTGAGFAIEQTADTLLGPRLVGFAELRYRLWDPGVISLRAGVEVVRDPDDPDRQITPVAAGRAELATAIRPIGLGMTLVYERGFRTASRRIGVGVRDSIELTIGYVPEASPLLVTVTATGAHTDGFTEEIGETIPITAWSAGLEVGSFLTLTRNLRLFLEYNMGFIYEQLDDSSLPMPVVDQAANPAMTHVVVAGIQVGFGTDHDALERLISQDRFSEFAIFDVDDEQRRRRQQPGEPDRRDPVDEPDPTDRPRRPSEEAPGPGTDPEGGDLEPPDPADSRRRRGRYEREVLERQLEQQAARGDRRALRPTDRRRRPGAAAPSRPTPPPPAPEPPPTEAPPPIVPVMPTLPGATPDGAPAPAPAPTPFGAP